VALALGGIGIISIFIVSEADLWFLLISLSSNMRYFNLMFILYKGGRTAA